MSDEQRRLKEEVMEGRSNLEAFDHGVGSKENKTVNLKALA